MNTHHTQQERELDISLEKTKVQIEGHRHAKNFYWLNGIEEYLQHKNHPQLNVFEDIKNVVLYANPWALKKCVMREIERGQTEHTQEWINIIMSKFIYIIEYILYIKCLAKNVHFRITISLQ